MGGMIVSEIASRYKLAGAVLIGSVNPNPLSAEIFAKRIETVRQSEKAPNTARFLKLN